MSQPLNRRLPISLFLAAAAAAAVSLPAAFAQDGPPRGGRGQGRPTANAPQEKLSEEEAHEAFEHAMSDAGRAWRTLRNSSFDADSQEADLQAIQSLQTALLTAKPLGYGVHMSPQAQEKYGDDKQAYEMAIRSQLLDALSSAMTLERAVLDGDADAAKAAIEELNMEQREGHGEFRRGRDNTGRPGGGPGGRRQVGGDS